MLRPGFTHPTLLTTTKEVTNATAYREKKIQVPNWKVFTQMGICSKEMQTLLPW